MSDKKTLSSEIHDTLYTGQKEYKTTVPILPKKDGSQTFENGTVDIDDAVTDEQIKNIKLTD